MRNKFVAINNLDLLENELKSMCFDSLECERFYSNKLKVKDLFIQKVIKGLVAKHNVSINQDVLSLYEVKNCKVNSCGQERFTLFNKKLVRSFSVSNNKNLYKNTEFRIKDNITQAIKKQLILVGNEFTVKIKNSNDVAYLYTYSVARYITDELCKVPKFAEAINSISEKINANVPRLEQQHYKYVERVVSDHLKAAFVEISDNKTFSFEKMNEFVLKALKEIKLEAIFK
jgi:hypothetical protein